MAYNPCLHAHVDVRFGPNGERITLEGQPHKTGIWTEVEDEMLYMWQQRIGNKWTEVARHIPGKTGQQCAQRWRHRVNPDIKRDKWSGKEDALLVRLVEMYGNQWALIARYVPGRTDQQCMGRWRRHLDPMIRRERWKQDEDILLCASRARYKTQWSQISKVMCGRTPQQCRTRWQHISTNMKAWLEQNAERIKSVDLEAVERSRGLDMHVGARNAKDVVKREGEEMRERAAMKASALATLPDAATLETELASELAIELGRKGIGSSYPSSHPHPSGLRNAHPVCPHEPNYAGDVPLSGGPVKTARQKSAEELPHPSSLPTKGSTASASKGSTPSAPAGVGGVHVDAFEDSAYGNELMAFRPVDIVKILKSADFVVPPQPKPTSVESIQPSVALRLSEPLPGMHWEHPYLPGKEALRPFQPFKEFLPNHPVLTAPPIGLAGSGAGSLGAGGQNPIKGLPVPIAISKPAPHLPKRAEISETQNERPNGLGGAGEELVRAVGKRQRDSVEWVNPDLEEELRLRQAGGNALEIREQEIRGLLYIEGATY